MQRRLFIPIAVSVLALGIAACGGDGNSSSGGGAGDDKAEIAQAIKRAFTTQDGNVSCKELSSKAFITRVYGDVAQCLKVEAKDHDPPPEAVPVSDITVTGDTGTAHARFVGGETDGTNGTIQMRKESGDWRMDDLGADLLRSVLTKGMSDELKKDDTFKKPAVRNCVTKIITDLPDARLKEFAYGAIGDRAAPGQDLASLVTSCLTKAGSGAGSGDTSFVREKFEQGIEQSLGSSGVPAATITCIKKKLRASISDEELGKLSTNGGKTSTALQKAVVQALTACKSRTGGTSQ